MASGTGNARVTLADLVPYLKAVHITGLAVWCAGLFALPAMLAWHDPAIGQADYRRIRRATHYTYTLAVTPAAVAAVISGTWLVLIREVYDPWFILKLVFVSLLVAFHGWVGHTITEVAETPGSHRPPSPAVPNAVLMTLMLAILTLVLAKPEFDTLSGPAWLMTPLERQLPFAVPNR
ncbi:CopD family protein [Cereibacter sphaeroides]|uniref:CopD family protein n=1 Tax=Cereibacter sphaeroides TaxID=1063 RepID=UPI001F4337CA|nr:CopD family protein [Cereibacter sphaeroides]MCE6951531.1 CopD family protein [Cereibacter sphaeroides]